MPPTNQVILVRKRGVFLLLSCKMGRESQFRKQAPFADGDLNAECAKVIRMVRRGGIRNLLRTFKKHVSNNVNIVLHALTKKNNNLC